MKNLSSLISLVALVALLGACEHFGFKRAPESIAGGDRVPRLESSTTEPSRPNTDVRPEQRLSRLEPIHFGFDSAVLPSSGLATLKNNARIIRTNPGWHTITIEGHCDERGSEEYNFALGERRADVVRKTLAAIGVDQTRLKIVSFGELQPRVLGSTEKAWTANRRAEFSLR